MSRNKGTWIRGGKPPSVSRHSIVFLLCAAFTSLSVEVRSEGVPDVSSSPIPAPRKSGMEWIAEHKGWILAGGGALFTGVLVWTLASSEEKKESPKTSPLGNPPEDPLVKRNP